MESDKSMKGMLHDILSQMIALRMDEATKEIAKALAVMTVSETPEARAITVKKGIDVIAQILPGMVEEFVVVVKDKMDKAKAQVKHE